MPATIPQAVKDAVFQIWQSGLFRKAIAAKHHVSEGTVSNIIAEKKKKLQYGSDQLESLRDLSVAMNISGLSTQECVDGHRVAMLMRKMGVDEENFEDFISKLNHIYIKTGLSPALLKEQADELYYFHSQNNTLGTGVSIFQVCNNISNLKSVEASLNHEVTGLMSKKTELDKTNLELQAKNSAERAELGANMEFKDKLKANGFQNEEILESVDLALLVKRSGYTIAKAMEKFSDFSRFDTDIATMQQIILRDEVTHNSMLKDNAFLDELLEKNSQTLRELEYVKEMGFGLQELKKLRHKLEEVDEQAGKSAGSKASVEKFFKFFDEYYCDFYNLYDKVKEFKTKITESSEKLEHLSGAFGLTPDIAVMTYSLAQKGIHKYDLPDLARKIEEKHRSSNAILFNVDTTSNLDPANSKKPSLVSEESNPSANNDKRSDLGDIPVKTDLLSSDCCPKQKRIEDVVRGGKTSPESHKQTMHQDVEKGGRAQQEVIRKGYYTTVFYKNYNECRAANPSGIDPVNQQIEETCR